MLVFATAIAPVPLPVSVIGVSGWYPEPATDIVMPLT